MRPNQYSSEKRRKELEKKKKKEGRFLAFSGRFWVVFHGEVRC